MHACVVKLLPLFRSIPENDRAHDYTKLEFSLASSLFLIFFVSLQLIELSTRDFYRGSQETKIVMSTHLGSLLK